MLAPEEKILVFKLKQGDTGAFEQLFLTYHKKLYHFGNKILNNKEESEGLIQSVFMEIWENRDKIDVEKSFSGYLFKITKNKIYNLLRKSLNEKVYKNYILNYTSLNNYQVEENYETKQLAEILDNLIDKLPVRRKEIFLLSRNEGFTYKEISAKLKISVNTVDTQIRKVLDYLREQIQDALKENI